MALPRLRHSARAVRAVVPVLALTLAACGRGDDSLVEHRLYAMATWVDLTLPAGATRDHPDLVAEIERELDAFGRDYYAWGSGELARLNAALSAAETFEASPALAAVLARAQAVARASDGAFDPGVGGLVELYGLHDAGADESPLPDDAAIDAERVAAGSILDVEIDGTRIAAARAADDRAADDRAANTRPGGSARRYTLDLGGIAKGTAVDRIAGRLEALGIAPALVNAGGNLRAVGERPDRPWRIGIQAPRDDGLLGSLELRAGEAAATSGDYERFRDSGIGAGADPGAGNDPGAATTESRRLHHILDPRTGRPATHTVAVTVIAGDAETADAASTALFVAGPSRWLEVARRLGVVAALRVDAAGAIEMTRAMRDRFQPGTSGVSAIIAVVD